MTRSGIHIIAMRIATFVAMLCIAAPAAYAQKTKSQLVGEIAVNLPDNNQNQITPAVVRSTLIDMVDSYYDLNGQAGGACASHQWVMSFPTLSSFVCSQPGPGDLSGLGSGVAAALGNALNDSGGLVGYNGALGTPSSGTLTNATGLPIGGLTGLGTGVATALGDNIGSAGAVVVNGGAGGTPSSLTLTNATGLPIAGLASLGTGVATALADAVNGTGGFVTYGGSLGTPAQGVLTNATGLPIGGLTGLGTGVATGLADAVNTSGGFATSASPVFSGSFTGTYTLGGTPSIAGSAINSGTVSASYLPSATNAALGVMRGDGTTLSCTAGVCTSLGGAASSIDAGGATTAISNGVGNAFLYDDAGNVGNTSPNLTFASGVLTMSGGGFLTSGSPPLTVTSVTNPYFGSDSLTWLASPWAAASATLPEVGFQFVGTSNVGSANTSTAFKIGGFVSMTCSSGSAACYGLNTVTQFNSGFSGNGFGYENDLNWGTGASAGAPGTSTAVYNQAYKGVASSSSFQATGAIDIEAVGSNKLWQYGIIFGAGINFSAILDKSSATNGIDFTGATHTYDIIAANNQVALAALNTGAVVIPLLSIDGSNNINFGTTAGIGQITVYQALIPSVDNTFTVGKSGARWNAIWAANGTIQTSDRRAKKDFENLPAALPIINSVTPQTYKWRKGTDMRRHWGLIAQDLDAATEATGVEFGGIDKSNPDMFGLNYAETNSILWKAAQETQHEIESLDTRVAAIERHALQPTLH